MRFLMAFVLLLIVFAFHYTDTAHFEVEVAPGGVVKVNELDKFVLNTITETVISPGVDPNKQILTDSHRFKLLGINPDSVPEGRFDATMQNYILVEGGKDIAIIMSPFYTGKVDTVWIDEFPLVNSDLTVDEKVQLDYINKWKSLAKKEEARTGIPAGIKLAQGILESNSGRSFLAQKANNHFGIKCFGKSCSYNHCVNRHDDKPTDMFVRFKTPEASFVGNSKVLEKKRYKKLFEIKRNGKWTKEQLFAWADGLKEAGYATSKTYNVKLKRLIEKYNLHEI